MLKKVMLGTALSMVLVSGAEAHVRTGFYTGAAVGMSKNQGTGTATYREGAANAATATQTPSFKQTGSGFVGQIFAGYEAPLSPSFVLGGEFAVSLDTAQSKQNWNPGTNTNYAGAIDFRKNILRQNYKLGLSVNAGVPVGDSVTIYGKVGVVNGRFTLKHENAGFNTANYYGGKCSKNLWGIEPGVRVKVAMNHGWAVQFDANYAFYQGFKSKNFQTGNGSFGTNIAQVKVTPRIWTFLAGVSYKF